MATTTPFLGLRKPTNTGGVSNKGDPIDVVADISNNMDTIDTFASTVSAKFGTSAQDFQSPIATITATSYSETFGTSNTPAALTFVAPPSGKGIIHMRSWLDHQTSTTARTFIGYVLRTGGTIGSGTVIQAADDNRAIHNVGQDDIECGASFYVSGLTPGATYNLRNSGKTTSGTGESQNRELIFQPTY